MSMRKMNMSKYGELETHSDVGGGCSPTLSTQYSLTGRDGSKKTNIICQPLFFRKNLWIHSVNIRFVVDTEIQQN